MPATRIKDKFMQLPLPQKVIGIGALFAFLSVFLIWYQDIDAFNTGDSFLGITGPLYLIGYIIIGLSLFSLALTGFHFLEKKIPALPMKESMIYILSGATSLFLLVIANSVYFHPKFGINITSKEYGIGMMLAFVSSIAVTVGGVLQHRERGTSRFIKEFQEETQTEEKIDPIVELNNFQKEQEELKKLEVEKEEPKIRPEPVINTERTTASSGVREYKAKPKSRPGETTVRSEPYPDPKLLRKEREATSSADKDGVNPNSVIRMDL